MAIANAMGHQRPVRASVYETVVIPLDGSQLARRVLPHALTLARAFDCRIHLVRATGAQPIGQRWDQPALSSTADEDADLTPAEAIAREVDGLRGSGLEVTATVTDGAAADVIVETAEEQAASMIAMTTHGRSGIDRWLLGSVADKVLQMSASPLLLVRSDSQINLTHGPLIARVVLALDGSKFAELAVSHAAAIGKKLRVPVTVLQVVRYGGAAEGTGISTEDDACWTRATSAQARARTATRTQFRMNVKRPLVTATATTYPIAVSLRATTATPTACWTRATLPQARAWTATRTQFRMNVKRLRVTATATASPITASWRAMTATQTAF